MADDDLEALSVAHRAEKMQKDVGREMPIYVEWQKTLNGSCTGHMTCGA
jgi:hypothetical protein